MAEPIYLTLTGNNQGLISAGCSTIDSIGNRHQIGHEDEIQVISLNSGSFRSQNAAYQPVVFAKLIDKSSPLLSTSLDSNEVLEAVFVFYRTSQRGQLEKYYEVKLSGVSLIEVSDIFPDSIKDNESMPFQRIQMKYGYRSVNYFTCNSAAVESKGVYDTLESLPQDGTTKNITFNNDKVTFYLTEETVEAKVEDHLVGRMGCDIYRDRMCLLTSIDTFPKEGSTEKIKGLGASLLKEAACFAEKNKCTYIELAATQTKTEEKHPRGFYEKFGFVVHQLCQDTSVVTMRADPDNVIKSVDKYLTESR